MAEDKIEQKGTPLSDERPIVKRSAEGMASLRVFSYGGGVQCGTTNRRMSRTVKRCHKKGQPSLRVGDIVDVWMPTGVARYHELKPAKLVKRIDKFEWQMELSDGELIYACEGALLGFQRRQ